MIDSRLWLAGSCLAGALACAAAPQAGNIPKAGETITAALVDPYLKIQEALADDKVDGVKAAAGEIASAAAALGAPAIKIDTAAIELAGAAEIEDAREKFGTLSAAIDTYLTGLKLRAPEGVKVAYCPMVNKPWLQKGEAISNPYYGSSMLTCGNLR
jgi:HPt (histidine-containing phosphotransfer) domain-containing protein